MIRLVPLLAAALVALAACESGPPPPSVAASPAPAASAAAPAAAVGARMAPGGLAPAPTRLPGPDSFANRPDQPWQEVAEAPVSTFALTGDTASYSLARRVIGMGHLPRPEMVRAEEFLNAFAWNYPRPTDASRPIASFVSVHPAPWAPDRQLLHIGLRTRDAAPAARARLNLVFLVDVSGSMGPEDRLPLLRQGLRMLLPQLRAEDRVSLVTYASGVRVLLDSVPGNRQDEIAAAIDGLRAGGATAGQAGLATAYGLAARNLDRAGVNRVVLATDGDFNLGIRSPAELKDFITLHRRQGIYLTAIGVGLDNFNDRTLHTLAKAGNGSTIYAGSLEDLRRGLVEDFAANILPAADDVKVQVEFNPAAVRAYRLIGYETRGLRREDFRDDSADAGELGSGRAVTAIYEIVPAGAARPPVAPLRYAPARPAAARAVTELAFLRVAYKLPGQARSQEIARPITPADAHASFAAAPEEARFAAAVAGFAQLLRRAPQLGAWGFAEAAEVAAGARGADADGRRAEFVTLARLAAQLRASQPR